MFCKKRSKFKDFDPHQTKTHLRLNISSKISNTNHDRRVFPSARYFIVYVVLVFCVLDAHCVSNSDLDKTERFLDKINEQSIAAVFNKVAYGSTTKRSIPDNAYIYTTLATPLLTTYRYSDGNQEWFRVDVKEPETIPSEDKLESEKDDLIIYENKNKGLDNYGVDLEKDHALPTSAPAADILKNNNNKNYNNPNRYGNDKLRPEVAVPMAPNVETVTERDNLLRTSTGYSVLRNVRPTKSMFGKEIPSYVPPSRSFFTPPLPPEYLNPFADKPTLRGTNSDTYQNRRPIPPPSLMPKKDRIPFRPDLPPSVNENSHRSVVNSDLSTSERSSNIGGNSENQKMGGLEQQRKKTLNTPSQNVHLDRLGEYYGLNRLHNESNFEYEPSVYIPSISRILSGSNGRKEDIPDILLRTVTTPPNFNNRQKTRHEVSQFIPPSNVRNMEEPEVISSNQGNTNIEEENTDNQQQAIASASVPKSSENEQNTHRNRDLVSDSGGGKQANIETTTILADILNLPNVKIKRPTEMSNTTRAASTTHEVWSISWNVHVYLVVFLYVLLAIFSIVKLVRFERESHMFSKSYFLSVHLLLTTICVLRIFYLAYDPYNVNYSFGNFTYDILHNLPLSLLATTFAILIVFLLKRTLNHLKVKTRPVFLVLFSLGHMFLCFCLNLAESFQLFGRGSILGLICRFVYILLCLSLCLSYVYLYKIIKNVLAKKSQNLSEICTQNISYASHITIAIALLFALLGFVQLYGLFFIKIDRFVIPYHWILWGFELSVRLLEISIITLLAIVVSLRMSQREKQNVGFPLFPCTTSDSSTDNIYPNNCNTNLNALNYSLRSTQQQYRSQLSGAQNSVQSGLDSLPSNIVDRPNIILDKKSTLERCFPSVTQNTDEPERNPNFERFERPNWGSQRFAPEENFPNIRNFEPIADEANLGSMRSEQFEQSSARSGSGRFLPANSSSSNRSSLKPYEKCRYYAKPKYDSDAMYNSSSGTQEEENPKLLKRELRERMVEDDSNNLYSEPLDISHSAGGNSSSTAGSDYERRYAELDRVDLERRSRTSWSNSGRRSTGRSSRKTGQRAHTAGVHTLPNQDASGSMLVDDNGFVRFRQLAGEHEQQSQTNMGSTKSRKHHRYHHNDLNHYSDA